MLLTHYQCFNVFKISYAQQSCIYLIKKNNKFLKLNYYNFKWIHFLF